MADRLLEFAGNVDFASKNQQLLDSLLVERQRGITVKAQTASMFYKHSNQAYYEKMKKMGGILKGPTENYLINLIDTPGHVDFSYEVSRSLAACQGVLMLVDSTQGIQAQTLANYYLAYEAELDIIPVITKIDLPNAQPDDVAKQIEDSFGIDRENCLKISSKSGFGVEGVFQAIVERIRCPGLIQTGKNRALLFDSWFDGHRGVIALLNIVEGEFKVGDWIASYHSGICYQILDLGLLMPIMKPLPLLRQGQVGYVVSNIKNSREVRLGDTFYVVADKEQVKPTPADIIALPGFKPARSMVYAGLFPIDADDFEPLQDAISKLTLNDASVAVGKEHSVALGQGFRCGFLGVLHMEVFHQRLEQEFGANIISTAPTVPYVVTYKDGTVIVVSNPAEFPDAVDVGHCKYGYAHFFF